MEASDADLVMVMRVRKRAGEARRPGPGRTVEIGAARWLSKPYVNRRTQGTGMDMNLYAPEVVDNQYDMTTACGRAAAERWSQAFIPTSTTVREDHEAARRH